MRLLQAGSRVRDLQLRRRGSHRCTGSRGSRLYRVRPRRWERRRKDHVTVVVDTSAHPTWDPRPIARGVAVYEPVIPRLGDRFRDRSARVEFPSELIPEEHCQYDTATRTFGCPIADYLITIRIPHWH